MYYQRENSLDSVYHFLNEKQKLKVKDLLLEFQKEGFVNHGYLPDFNIDQMCKKIDLDIEFIQKQKQAEIAAFNNKTTIPEEHWGVHTRHCCSKHGCKYNNIDCPVVIGLVKQEFPCELCEYQNI